MGNFLGIDIGGTGSRWVLIGAEGAEIARGAAGGATGLLNSAANRATLAEVLAAIRAALPAPVAAVHLGVTGAGLGANPELEALAAEAFAPARVSWSNDVVLAWHAAFPEGGGHLVSAGTGSIGVTLDAAGAVLAVGGRGILVDDAGSGSWIALTALDRLYRLIDEFGAPKGAERLAEAIFGAMGGADQAALRAYVYGSDRGRIGALAVHVGQAAGAGDPLALAILREAGAELARLARAMMARRGRAPVAVIGGVLRLHPALRDSLAEALAGHDLRFPEIDAPLQAARIARKAALAG